MKSNALNRLNNIDWSSHVRAYSWVTIEYKYHDLICISVHDIVSIPDLKDDSASTAHVAAGGQRHFQQIAALH